MSALYEALPIFAQNLACTWAGYRRSRMRFTPHFHRMLAEWERLIGDANLEYPLPFASAGATSRAAFADR